MALAAMTSLTAARADQLYGGTDTVRDVFVFTTPGNGPVGVGHDTVFEFHHGVDDIYLKLMDADRALTGNQDFIYNGTTPKAHAVWFTVSGTDVLVHGDVNGNTVADFEIKLSQVTMVSAIDFIL